MAEKEQNLYTENEISDNTSELILNLGGEGEVLGVINVNHPVVLSPHWGRSRDGASLKAIKKSGPLVVCRSDRLPFLDNCAERVITNSVPIDRETWLGPGYSSKEIARIKKQI